VFDYDDVVTEPLDASVVIPARNAAATLAAQLEALVAQDAACSWEVVVADNGSTDDTAALAQGFADRLPRLVVADASARRGIAAARNAGVRATSGRVVCFCDGDDVVAPNWLSAMVAALERVDGVSSPLRPFLSTPGDLGDREVPGWVPGPMPHLTGCSLGVKADVLASVGGFDEDWDRGGGDDVEFSLRLLRAGARLGSADATVVHRRERPDLRGTWRQHYTYGHEAPRIAREFSDLVPDRSVPGQAKEVLVSSVRLASLGWRDRDVVTAHGHATGRLVGSVRYRLSTRRDGA
jgi:glycosyltransferase involved in cell wall biosynthesis